MAILESQIGLQQEIERLRAENERLKAASQTRLGCKVTEKGGVSVYGLGRFPVTLYRGQWERLFGAASAVKAFIEANREVIDAREQPKA